MSECCEKSLVKWGLKTVSGTLVNPRISSPRYGQRMSTTRSSSTYLPMSPLIIIDIIARDAGILEPLLAYYVGGWKEKRDREGKPCGYRWKPDKRRQAKAHAARKLLAEMMEVEETDEPERE